MIGQHVIFTTNSSIYRETYESKILDIKDNMMAISMPYHNGVIVLPGVGTKLSVNISTLSCNFQSEILERNIVRKYLKIATPNSIVRSSDTSPSRPAKVLAVTSGKGGVGKTCFSISFAIALQNLGKRVLLFDADLGMANVDVLLNIKPEFDIQDVISGDKSINEVILKGPGGVNFIPGASGLQQLAYLSDSQFNRIITGFNEIEKDFDYLIIDTGAGLSKNVTNFLLSCDEILLVTTPEPHAVMDAYSIIKVIKDLNTTQGINLIINRCESRAEALVILNKMRSISQRFLKVNINYLGYIQEDRNVTRSIKSQVPLMLMYPDSPSSRCIKYIAETLSGVTCPQKTESGMVGFLNKLKNLF